MSTKLWDIKVTDEGIELTVQVGHNSHMLLLSDEQTSLLGADLSLAAVEAAGRRVQIATANLRKMLGQELIEERTIPLPRPNVEIAGTKH